MTAAAPVAGLEPISLDFSGTTDANGNYKLTRNLFQAYWCNCKLIGTTTGNPGWLVQVSGSPAAIGLGPQSEIGPFIVPPAALVDVILTTGIPNSPIRGQFVGVRGDLLPVMASFAPAPNTLAIQQSAPQIVLGSTGPLAASAHQFFSYPLPPGAHAVAITSTFGPGNIAQIVISGNISRIYGNAFPQNPDPWPFYQPVLAVDTQIGFDVTMGAGGGITNIWFLAILNPQAVTVIPGRIPWGVNLIDASGNVVGIDVNAGFENLLVSHLHARPAPWQAAAKMAKYRAAPGAATDFTIIAAPGVGVGNYLHAGMVNSNSNVGWEVTLWDGPSANAVPIGEMLMTQLTAVGMSPPIPFDLRGFRQISNNALVGRLDAGQAGATVYMHVGYSPAA